MPTRAYSSTISAARGPGPRSGVATRAGDRSAAPRSLFEVLGRRAAPSWLPRPSCPAGLSLVLLPGRARPPAPPGAVRGRHSFRNTASRSAALRSAPAAEDLHSVGLLTCRTLPRASRVGTEATDRAFLGAALQACQLHLAPCSRPPQEWRPRRPPPIKSPRSAWLPSPSSARRRAARAKMLRRDELEREN